MEPTREIMWNVHWMRWPIYLPALLALGIAVWGMWREHGRRLAFFEQARPDPDRAAGLGRRVLYALRYLFGHQRILRELYPGVMHFLLFFGFFVLLLVTLAVMVQEDFTQLLFGVEFLRGPTYLVWSLAGDLFGIALLAGTTMALWRRYVTRAPRLDTRPLDLWALLLLLLLGLSGFFVEGLRMVGEGEVGQPWAPWSPLGWLFALALRAPGWSQETIRDIHVVTWMLHMVAGMVLVATLPWSKLWHMVPGLANVALVNRRPRADLPVLTMEDLEDENAETFGVHRVDELTWKDLLDGDACMRCGRCTAACPAQQTGKALDPKKVIQDLKENVDDKLLTWADARGRILEDVDRDAAGRPLLAGSTAQQDAGAGTIRFDELWACTNCAACQEACPVHIEHVPKIQALRQYLTLMESDFPQEAQPVMRNLENNGNPWGIGMAQRHEWAEGLDVPTFDDQPDAEYLFFPGCSGAFDERNKKVARATVRLLQAAGVRFATLGGQETCCGDPARRMGNEYLFAMTAQQNLELFRSYGIRKVITICPHGLTVLGTEYRRHGGDLEVVHHAQLIAQLIEQGRLRPSRAPGQLTKLTYHDSCYLGRWNGIYEPQRRILRALPGCTFSELPRHGSGSFCCGAGGGRIWMEETEGKRVNHDRVQEVLDSGANTLAAACPLCMIMLGDAITGLEKGEQLELKDISELVLESLESR